MNKPDAPNKSDINAPTTPRIDCSTKPNSMNKLVDNWFQHRRSHWVTAPAEMPPNIESGRMPEKMNRQNHFIFQTTKQHNSMAHGTAAPIFETQHCFSCPTQHFPRNKLSSSWRHSNARSLFRPEQITEQPRTLTGDLALTSW